MKAAPIGLARRLASALPLVQHRPVNGAGATCASPNNRPAESSAPSRNDARGTKEEHHDPDGIRPHPQRIGQLDRGYLPTGGRVALFMSAPAAPAQQGSEASPPVAVSPCAERVAHQQRQQQHQCCELDVAPIIEHHLRVSQHTPTETVAAPPDRGTLARKPWMAWR